MGNPILGDDSVGLVVAADAKKHLSGDPAIEVAEEHHGGLRLMERLVGYERVVIVDAIVTGKHAPGTILRLGTTDIPTQHTASTHDVNLATALRLAADLGLSVPRKIEIVAIEADQVLDFSSDLTPAVAAAVPAAVAVVIELLRNDVHAAD
jgi:hydrogenase maturation protease